MHAMLLHNPAPLGSNPLKYEQIPDPTPSSGEVRVKVRVCAICRTDLHIVEGDITPPHFPIVPGHQIVGIVDRLGPNCRRLKIGRRIGVAWLRHTCGVCRFCTSGRENLCEFSQYTGFHANGGYAEFANVPEDFAYELPDGYDDIAASPLLCAGIIGYRAFKRCNPKPGDKIGIFGFGSSAHIHLQIARHRGHEVYVVSRSKNHQDLARQIGATWCGPDASQIPVKLNSAIVFAPAGTIVPDALSSIDRGGIVSLAGIHMTPIPQLDYDKYLYGERDLHPVEANTRQDGRDLLAEAGAANVRPHTSVYSLKDANQALADMKSAKIDGTGVLVISKQ
jgi:propanol-preferring alcohol dehydrogenase